MHTIAIVFALYLPSAWGQNSPAPAQAAVRVTAPAAPVDLGVLLEAGRHGEIAVHTGDPTLVRRLAELEQALVIQVQFHKIYQPRHPRRDGIDDRVRLLEASVATAARDAVARAVNPPPAPPPRG